MSYNTHCPTFKKALFYNANCIIMEFCDIKDLFLCGQTDHLPPPPDKRPPTQWSEVLTYTFTRFCRFPITPAPALTLRVLAMA